MRAALVATLTVACVLGASRSRAQTPPTERARLAAVLSAGSDAADQHRDDRARTLLDTVAHGADATLAAQSYALLGEVDERDLRFAEALMAYRASTTLDPGGRYAARAAARVEWLSQRSEGDFAPLTQLERVRQDPARARDAHAVDELDHAAPGFPPGIVRAETRLLVGQAYIGRLEDPRRAIAPLTALVRDPTAPGDVRRLGADLLGQARDALDEFAEGAAEVQRYGGDPTMLDRLREHARRERLRRIALVVTASLALAGLFAFAQLVRTRRLRAFATAWFAPLPLAHIALFAVGGALLAHTWDQHPMTPFFALGAGALGVYSISVAWSHVGSVVPLVRVLRAVTCAAGMLAVSFLVMRYTDTGLLDGIGL